MKDVEQKDIINIEQRDVDIANELLVNATPTMYVDGVKDDTRMQYLILIKGYLMKKVILVLCIFSFSILFANEGEDLHQESCLACHVSNHDKKFYTSRVNKKMTTLAKGNLY